MSKQEQNHLGDAIAVIGLACKMPGAKDAQAFWNNLRNAVESITFFTDDELRAAGISDEALRDTNYVKAKAVIDDIAQFDAAFFGLNPREAEYLDPQHRLFIECTYQALENAGYANNPPGVSIGVFAGVCGSDTYYLKNLFPNPDLMRVAGYQIYISNDKDFLPTRTSYLLNLKGPSVTIQTACSTSLVAVSFACQALRTYQCDIAVAGAATITLPSVSGYVYREGMIMSPDGHCRAFDAQAKGTVGGNGVGVIILKRFDEALADNDNILAIIRGWGLNNDGAAKVGYTAPSADGQAEAIAHALAISDVNPDTIGYIEAHGTGTALGDPIEISALTRVFREKTQRKQFCAIGSVKSNIGHLDAAAGMAGIIKTVLALHHKEIPPSLHFQSPNPEIDFENSPFYVQTTRSEWKSEHGPRRAGVSAFGIGGSNAHVILEEAPPKSLPEASRPWQLLLLSAKTRPALETLTSNLIDYLQAHPELPFPDVAYTLQVTRTAHEHRRMLVCQDADDAAIAATTLGTRRVFTEAVTQSNRPIVYMFSGQGSQYVNMGLELYQNEPVFREQIDQCADLLIPELGFDLRTMLYPAGGHSYEAASQLKQTQVAQPALFSIEYAMAILLMSWGINPSVMIGHSIGEYVAACIAGVLTLGEALSLIAARGRLMQSMEPGKMLGVSMTLKDIKPILPDNLSIAALNSPSMSVVSGPADSIDDFVDRLDEDGIEYHRLETSHAFHSWMMQPAADSFREKVANLKLRPPQIPFISNVTGTWITDEQATDPGYWAMHIRECVLFSNGLEQLLKDPDRILLEVGPGKSLTTLARQQPNKASQFLALPTLRHPHEQQSDVGFLLNTAGRLWLAGTKIHWAGFYAHEQRGRVPLPTYPFDRQRYWIDPPKFSPHELRAQSQRNPSDITEWFHYPTWKRTVPLHMRDFAITSSDKHTWLIFMDDADLGLAMASWLLIHGFDTMIVRPGVLFEDSGNGHYRINPAHPADYETLLRTLAEAGKAPRFIAHLWSVTPNRAPVDLNSTVHQMNLGFYSLVYLSQAIGKRRLFEPITLGIGSNRMQRIGEINSLEPGKAALLGPCKTIPKEFTNITCISIDVALPDTKTRSLEHTAQMFIREIVTPSTETVVAFRGAERWVQTYDPVRLPPRTTGSRSIREGGVYLITGGLSGIGLVLAKHLAKTARAKLVLAGRTPLPPRNQWDAALADPAAAQPNTTANTAANRIQHILDLEKLGASVLPLSGDVADPAFAKELIQKTIDHFGKLHGVIHSAGVPGGGMIQRKSKERADAVLSPKVAGTIALKNALEAIPSVDFFLLCSSLTSVLGAFGQVDYAAANAFQDAFAHAHTQEGGTTTISVNWDSWQEVGMAAESVRHRAKSIAITSQSTGSEMAGDASVTSTKNWLTPDEGVEIFERIVDNPIEQVLVLKENLQNRIQATMAPKAKSSGADSSPPDSIPRSVHPRPRLRNDYAAPRNPLEQRLADAWQKFFGIDRIGIFDDFFDLGGDSLLAVQLVSQLKKTLDMDIPGHSLLHASTIAALAELISQPPPSLRSLRGRMPPSLVKIKSGSGRQPLFLIHPVGGHVYIYRELAQNLDAEQPVFALQAHGLDGKSKPLDNVSEMAEQYINAVRAVQPEGPYMLGGASFGGVVAYEMAQQLLSAGQHIALLFMIDSPSPGQMPSRFVNDADVLAYLLGLGSNLPVPSMRLQQLPPDERLMFFIKNAGIAKRILPDTALDQVRNFLRIFNSNLDAMLKYVPVSYPGRIIFFKASETDHFNSATPEAGWQTLAGGGVVVHPVPGNHITMNFTPNVTVIADMLRPLLEEAQHSGRQAPIQSGVTPTQRGSIAASGLNND